MSKLRNRIASVGSANYEAMGNYHPAGTADTPMVMPIHRVIMTADGATVERLTPMVTNQGEGSRSTHLRPCFFGTVQLYGFHVRSPCAVVIAKILISDSELHQRHLPE